MESDYWKDIAKYWKTTEDLTPKNHFVETVLRLIFHHGWKIVLETSDDDGRLGYCWMHHFKCHSARSCHTWAKGEPTNQD